MQSVQTIPFPVSWLSAHPQDRVAQAAAEATRDRDFLTLLGAYRATGGLATGAEIAARPPGTGFLQLARHIARRGVVSFVWREEIWLPVFQFKAGGQSVLPNVQLLIDELSVVLDDWDLAKWFVEPNSSLHGDTPLALVEGDFPRVHDAARALRFTHCI